MAFVLLTCLIARGIGLALEDVAADAPALVPLLYAVPLGLAALFGWALWAERRFVVPMGVRRARNRVWDAAVSRLAAWRTRLSAGLA